MDKVALARRLVRALAEKKAGLMLPLAAGAAVLGGAHVVSQGMKKARGYRAGFYPGGPSPESVG